MKNILFVFALAVQYMHGGTITWTDWTSGVTGQTNGSASGVINVAQAITVSYAGNLYLLQTGTGTNYWVPSTPYISADVTNPPPASELIAVNGGAENVITFSRPVINPVLALNSVNGPGVTFTGSPSITVLSSGCGYWGCGTLQVVGNVVSTIGGGEGHGTIRLNGTFNSITFAGGNETWRGFTIGIPDQTNVTPEPETWATLLIGGAFLAAARFRRSQIRL